MQWNLLFKIPVYAPEKLVRAAAEPPIKLRPLQPCSNIHVGDFHYSFCLCTVATLVTEVLLEQYCYVMG